MRMSARVLPCKTPFKEVGEKPDGSYQATIAAISDSVHDPD
jgi:hypothetical protein